MHQRIHIPGKYFAFFLMLLACLICPAKAAGVDFIGEKPDVPTTGDPIALDIEITTTPSRPRILVLLGLKEQANLLVEIAVAEEFGDMDVQQVHTSEAASPDYHWPEVDTVVSAGRSGCQLALQAVQDSRIFCTLLTEEGFHSLDTGNRNTSSPSLSALFIDQPASRQMQIANRVYPSLAQFSIFSGHGIGADSDEVLPAIDVFPFRATVALPPQLSDVLNTHDALIATSDSGIYNASTLSTVLLTAYGYGKPVIGYSRAYVKAGALLTCYSTPGQILRQAAKYLKLNSTSSITEERRLYPEYFSVADNPRVARSLGLVKEFQIITGETYTDADFKP